MIRKKLRMARMFSSLLIIFTMLLGLNVNAFAETSDGNDASQVSVGITNLLRANENIDVPSVIFQYSYTKDGLVDFTTSGSEAINKEVLADNTQPNLALANNKLQAEYNNQYSFTSKHTYPNMINNKKIYKVVGDNIIPEASKFLHAGIYSYTIKQEPILEGIYSKYLTCSQAVYKLFVYVENGENGLVVAGATAYKVKDDNGDTVESPAKIDLTKNTYAPGDGSDLAFINDYNPDNFGFTIVNNISGKYADMTKSFEYELTMLNPEGITGERTYKAVMIDEKTNLPISDELLSFTTGKATTFQMQDKQRLTFVKDGYVVDKQKKLTADETEFLPAGMSFELLSKAHPSYLAQFTLTLGGETDPLSVGNVGKSAKIFREYLNLGLNQVDITQCYKYVTVTGVVAKTMPPLIMLIFAVLGIALGAFSRRRNAA